MTTQSIIVYRNPAEAAFWEMAMQGTFVPVIIGAVVFFAVLLFTNHFFVEKSKWHQRVARSNFSIVISTLAGVFAAWYFWI